MLVLPPWSGVQAKPRRGAQSFLSGKLAPLGALGSPGNTSEVGAFTKRVDWAPGSRLKERPCGSILGVLYSYRTPSGRVSVFSACHQSMAKTVKLSCRWLKATV